MRENSVTGSVAIPLLRAAVTGLLCGVCFFAGYQLTADVTGWRIFWFVAAAVCLVVWWITIPQQRSSPGSRVYSSPVPETTKVEIVAADPAGVYKSGVWADFPVDKGVLVGAARYYAKTRQFSHAISGPGKPLTRNQFEAIRDEMLVRGLAYWRSPGSHNQGVALTRAGNAFLMRLAQQGAAQAHTGTHTPVRPEPHTSTWRKW